MYHDVESGVFTGTLEHIHHTGKYCGMDLMFREKLVCTIDGQDYDCVWLVTNKFVQVNVTDGVTKSRVLALEDFEACIGKQVTVVTSVFDGRPQLFMIIDFVEVKSDVC